MLEGSTCNMQLDPREASLWLQGREEIASVASSSLLPWTALLFGGLLLTPLPKPHVRSNVTFNKHLPGWARQQPCPRAVRQSPAPSGSRGFDTLAAFVFSRLDGCDSPSYWCHRTNRCQVFQHSCWELCAEHDSLFESKLL